VACQIEERIGEAVGCIDEVSTIGMRQ